MEQVSADPWTPARYSLLPPAEAVAEVQARSYPASRALKSVCPSAPPARSPCRLPVAIILGSEARAAAQASAGGTDPAAA